MEAAELVTAQHEPKRVERPAKRSPSAKPSSPRLVPAANDERALTFYVDGDPVPQGSKSGVVNDDGGVTILEGKTSEFRARFKVWRSSVTILARAAKARAGLAPDVPIPGPVAVELVFVIRRPKRPKFPTVPAVAPDLDKLVRAVLDALTAAKVYEDDARVVSLTARKVYSGVSTTRPAGVLIRVAPYRDTGVGPTSRAAADRKRLRDAQAEVERLVDEARR